MRKKIILGFSGGLDTSYCAIKLREEGFDPVCILVDVGQVIDRNLVEKRKQILGIEHLEYVDVKSEFADIFILPSLWANALYQGVYPLSTALTRPLIAKKMVDIAHEYDTNYFAHGCTGKGNDQIRIELGIKSLFPEAVIHAPIREGNLSRDQELDFLQKKGIEISVTKDKPYSIDENLWGRSVSAGSVENIEEEVPDDVYEWTTSPTDGGKPEFLDLTVTFEGGKPIALDHSELSFSDLIENLNRTAGSHSIGRIDHIEDRLVGIKSREIYECPAAMTLITAHRHLESLTLTRAAKEFKKHVEHEYSDLIYSGNWFSSHHYDLLAYLLQNQKVVSGDISLKLARGNIIVNRRISNNSLYNKNLVTYGKGSNFDQRSAKGYSDILAYEASSGFASYISGKNDAYKLLPTFNSDDRIKK